MNNENERILDLIQKMMNSEIISSFLKEYDYSINLFGFKISDNKHYFLRLSQPQDEIVLWMQEEYIPQRDLNGRWIEYPTIENAKVERLLPSSKYIPNDLTLDEFNSNLKSFFENLRRYNASHIKNKDITKLNLDIDKVLQELTQLNN